MREDCDGRRERRVRECILLLSSGYVVGLEKIFDNEQTVLITGMLLFGNC